MKRLFRLFSFLTLGLVACTGCTKKDTTPAPCTSDCVQKVVPDAAPAPVLLQPDAGATSSDSHDQKLSGNGWSLTLPEGWEPVEDANQDPNNKPELLLVNTDEHNLIILTKEDFLGSTQDFSTYTEVVFHAQGVTVSSKTEVDINGRKFILLDANKDNIRMWYWLTTKGGFGYGFACGGPANEDHHQDLCSDLVKTLQLK